MNYYKGNYFCINPITGPLYECRHILSIEKLPEHYDDDKIFEVLNSATPEWRNCIVDKISEQFHGIGPQPGRVPTLNDEAIQWLNENVAPSTDKRRNQTPQGWMIYNPETSLETISVSIFFLRGSDALAFKLRWE